MNNRHTQNDFDNQGSKISQWPTYQNFFINARMGRPIKVMPQPGTQAHRMKMLREAMGYQTQKGFAEFLGMTYELWNSYERGAAPVSRLSADLLVRKCPGLSTGWIQEGKEGDLSKGMLIRLGLMPPPRDAD